MYNDITGIILSGGKSLRMGVNKSFLKFGDETSISKSIDLMKSIFENVLLITNEKELYEQFGVQLFEDIYKGYGPLSGIHSGLVNSKTEKNFVFSCDIPLMNKKLILSIIEYPSLNNITLPKADGFIQQLCGVYSKKIIPCIESIFNDLNQDESRNTNQKLRNCKVHKLIENVPTTIIEDTELLEGYSKDVFINMNKPEDYLYIKNILI